MVALTTGCWRGNGANCGSARSQHRIQVEFEQHRRVRQLVGLAPLRVQFADEADAPAVELDSAAQRPGCSAGCCAGDEAQRARRQQRLDVALDVEEVDARAPCWPHCGWSASAVGQAADAHRLADAGHASVGRRRRRRRAGRRGRSRTPARATPCAPGCGAARRPGCRSGCERITASGAAIGFSTRIGSALPASSCSQRSSTKLKLMVSW